VVTNHPACGGSHLPDVTVITPVFSGRGRRPRLAGYVASRAHHAEIGGSRPGSMPPAARRLSEEGAVIPPTYLVRGGRPCWPDVQRLLLDGPWPTRRLSDNLADLRAALAANRAGELGLLALIAEHGRARVLRYMEGLEALAAERARQALERIGEGEYAAEERLDDGTPLAVRITIAARSARFDFSGTGAVHPGNLNAPPAVVRSVVMYVMRLLVREDLPLNEGLLDPVTLDVPRGLLDPPFPADPSRAPAVGGGNVETSQRLVDALVRALGLAAASQGTMNNVLFGDGRVSYYETIGGGAGAGPGFAGASAVHTHMTNTRSTDPEILELRYPVRLERFAVRRGSGGRGRYPGGDGIVREIAFLRPMSLSVVTQRRSEGPRGLAGGGPGAPGRQWIVRAGGRIEELGAIASAEVLAGDRFVIETPGGGGWGRA
jgi:5-oxoprolinase (ATP-hydrolysing)